MTKNEHEIETDITVYGATSFTAKHVLRYLMQFIINESNKKKNNSAGTNTKHLRVTLAGRNLSKLDKLFKSHEFTIETKNSTTTTAAADSSLSSASSIFHDIYIAPGSDYNALQCMAKRTRVVLNCAGPFALHSNLVVEACAITGTDYVDITGEGDWNANMRHQHSDASKKSGSRIISFCGYDSIPSDIALYMAITALRDRLGKRNNGKNIEIASAELWHTAAGFPSAGTLRTVASYPVDLVRDFFHDSAGWALRRVPFFVNDSLLLTHPQLVRNNNDETDDDDDGPSEYTNCKLMRNQYAWNEWMNQFPLSVNIPFNFGISVPFFMSAINMKVMHASAVALKYGKSINLRERYLPLGHFWTRVLGIMALIPLSIMQFCFYVGIVIFKFPIFRLGERLLDMFVPTGSGPSDFVCSKLHGNSVYAMVTAAAASGDDNNRRKDGLVDRGYCYLEFEGDAGNWVTAQCVCEAALALICNRNDLPPRSEDGFGTTAELLGPALVKRFQHSESLVRPITVSCHVRTGTPKYDLKTYING